PRRWLQKKIEKSQSQKLKDETRISQHKKIEHHKEKIQQELSTEKQKLDSFSQKEMEIIEGLNLLDIKLNKARVNVTRLSSEIKKLEGNIHLIGSKKQSLAKSINKNQDYVGARLEALYRMNRLGRLEIAGVPSSVFDFFLTQNAMKRIIGNDFAVLNNQNTDLIEFEDLEKALAQEMAAKKDLGHELKEQIRIKEIEGQNKADILGEIQNKKVLSMAAVASLKEAAQELENRILSISKEQVETMLELDGSFPDSKGRLRLPVKGKIISKFGPSKTGDYKSYTFQRGIDIRVDRGEPVHSVFKGTVMFAQWLKGYGNLLIINHGDNYYTLYAHLEELFKKTGESVETGEVIATAGDTGSIKGICLHFEVRHHGNPVNPIEWLKRGA
ncbi:MAG: peptidoglycan DD-metalloendopeptidase family protein, partial [Desulfobacteraceae bacterium]|nr:peptidoglycan DD-metalloendopeptidase family protein [Desulfobacteraceae bacterium]